MNRLGGFFRRAALSLCTLMIVSASVEISAQSGPDCGIVDSIDLPLDIGDTLARRFDDFARYRMRWGGNHVGIDLAFDREGEIVRAAMRGRVTVSNTQEWDTELGVVVLEHQMPDGSTVYSLYGHITESASVRFPPLGSCVERGAILGVIGDPSLSRPHLHYEIRTILRSEGGPGYVAVNPLDLGWDHPLDFTRRWQARFAGVVDGWLRLPGVPTRPFVILETGGAAYVQDRTLHAISPAGDPLWQIRADTPIRDLLHLPGDRLVTLSQTGSILVTANGRFLAQWMIPGARAIRASGDLLVIAADTGALYAYDPSGVRLWEQPGSPESTLVGMETGGAQIALIVRSDETVTWRLLGIDGALLAQRPLENILPRTIPLPNGTWAILDGGSLLRADVNGSTVLARISPVGREAALTGDRDGNIYVYAADSGQTLLSYASDGTLRWRARLSITDRTTAPLLGVGGGCALYALDGGGQVHVISTATGETVGGVSLYAGGSETASPAARLLRPFSNDQIVVGTGFLTALLLNGRAMANGTCG